MDANACHGGTTTPHVNPRLLSFQRHAVRCAPVKIRPRPCYETGARCTTATYLFLSTTLMVAYLAKSGRG